MPFCEPISITTVASNFKECDDEGYIRISFVTDFIGINDPFEYLQPINLQSNTAGLSLVSDVNINNNGNLTRIFTFSSMPIAANGGTFTNTFNFSLTPFDFPVEDDYSIVVELIQAQPGCQDFDGFISSFTVLPRLREVPISGTVSSLIAAGSLLSNSATNPIVEKKTISSLLDVDVNYSFDGLGGSVDKRPALYLFPGASIIVRSGATLTLTNADIFTCDMLAAGITVESGATLLASGCDFSDCRFAIDAKPGSNILVSGSTFSNNYIGINLDMSGVPEGSKRLATLLLSNNLFSTPSFVKAPYAGMPEAVGARGYCGIRLNDYRDFNVFGGNTFNNLANGILAAKTTMNIGNMTFFNMNPANVPAYPVKGYGIYLDGKGPIPYWANINELSTTMTFTNCVTGVYAYRYAGKVDKTTMSGVTTGIDWRESRSKDIRFRENNITASKLGIASYLNEPLHPISAIDDNTIVIIGNTSGSDPVTGIRLLESTSGGFSNSGWKVNRANITLTAGGRGILYQSGSKGLLNANTIVNLSQPNNYVGIRVEGSRNAGITANTITQALSAGLGSSDCIRSSGGWANTYQCNCLDNTQVGLQFFDLGDFTNAVRGNSMNTHSTGLQVGDDGVGDAFIGRQFHTGNFWDLGQIPSGQFGGVNWGNTSNIIKKSEFTVNGAVNPALNPPVDPGSGWFIPASGNTYSGCATCSFPIQAPPRLPEHAVPTGLDDAALTGDLPAGAMTWKGQYRLYRKMLRQPALQNYSTAYAAFFQAQQNQSVGQLAWVAEEQADLYSLSTADASTDSVYFYTLQQQNADLCHLDSLLAASQPVNAAQYSVLLQQRTSTLTDYAAFQQTRTQARQQRIQNLLQMNASVSGTQVWVTNHKTVNDIILNYLHSDSLAAGHLALLTAVADQCPLTGGDAVYEARVFVAQATGVDFDDRVLCAGVGARSQPEQDFGAQAPEAIVFYPNPTDGWITWTGKTDQAVTLRVFNSVGQMVSSIYRAVDTADLGPLTDGLYLIQMLSSENKLLATTKLQVVKN